MKLLISGELQVNILSQSGLADEKVQESLHHKRIREHQ